MNKEKIAKVVLPIALDKEFDYKFSPSFDIKRGMRVIVDFRGRKRLALVIKTSKTSKIKKLKTIVKKLDSYPVLNDEQILFSERLTKNYPYAKGEFLFMMLPGYLKKPHPLRGDKIEESCQLIGNNKPIKRTYIKADTFNLRYDKYKTLLRAKLEESSVLICFPQLSYLLKAKEILEKDFKDKLQVIHSQKKEKELFSSWKASRRKTLILGTRVSLFYYPEDLGLLIIEQENSPYYFQQEKPFHNLFDLAILLSDFKKIDLIAASDYPTLSAYRLIKEGKFSLSENKSQQDKINVVGLESSTKKKILSPVAIELLRKSAADKKRAVIIWNKTGFNRMVSCSNCGFVYKCSHCSGFLQSGINKNEGTCPYCHKVTSLPSVCTNCKNGYLKSRGFGIQRVEGMLKSLFPEVKIDPFSQRNPKSEFVLSTSKILSHLYEPKEFDSCFVLDIDAALMRNDYEATFNAYLYLKELALLCTGSLYLFTQNNSYYLFQYLNQEWVDYYNFELELRKKLKLPPYGLLVKITLRSKNENTLFKRSQDLYNKLQREFPQTHGPFKEQPFKLRDKYRYTIIIKTERNLDSRNIIKNQVKNLRSRSTYAAIQMY